IERASTKGIHFELLSILLATDQAQPDLEQEWVKLINEERSQNSLVAYGSPRVNHASELMLAKMFRVTPFSSLIANGEVNRVPFYFSWPCYGPRPLVTSSFGEDRPVGDDRSVPVEGESVDAVPEVEPGWL